MDFFKIYYFLKRILFNIPKKILVYILIFIIIMLFTTISHASQVDVNNLPNADIVSLYQKQIDHNFYVYTYKAIEDAERNNNNFGYTFKSFCRLATTQNVAFGIYTPNYYNLYFEKTGIYLNDSESWLCLAFSSLSNYTGDDTVVIPGTSNSNYGSRAEISCSVYSNSTILRFNTSSTTPSFYGNSGYNVTFIDAFQNYIPSDLYDVLYSIGNDTFSFTNDNQVLQDIAQKIDETNEQLEQMNEFFNSTTTPTITNNDLPSDNLNDITQSGFDGIFTKIYNKTTSSRVELIEVPIPFMNYNFYVTSDYLENLIYNQSFLPRYTLRTFIHLIWCYFIFRYIVLDIYKYINDFKNGNISKTDTNIKADML